MSPFDKNHPALQDTECSLMSLSDLPESQEGIEALDSSATAQCREVLEQSQLPNQGYGFRAESYLNGENRGSRR